MSEQFTAFLTLLFAMLAMVALLLAIAIVVSLLTGDRFGIIARLRPVAIEVAAAIAVTAMSGSLYYSELANYVPCRLCWIQRGFMYPAAILLIVALVTKQRRWAGVAGILAAAGLPVSIFHRFEQADLFSDGGVCGDGVSCALRYVNEFGFVTIPTMAGCGFAAIAALIGSVYWYDRRAGADQPDHVSVESVSS